jgi:hypothetical protein
METKKKKEIKINTHTHTHIEPLLPLYPMTLNSYKNTQKTQTWKRSQVPIKTHEKLRNLGVKSSSHRDIREIQTWERNRVPEKT